MRSASPDPAPLIGTAGWSIPRVHAERLAGPGSHLERYARVFRAVEINSTFHRPHRRATFERWAASTPPSFRFSVKLPKAITHGGALVGTEGLLDAFARQVEGLGPKHAIVLVQLPPKLEFDETLARDFFAAVRRSFGDHVCVAAEPRHPSWFTAAADAYLADDWIARVAADPSPVPGRGGPGGWHGFHYRRLHGSPRIYYSSYDAQRLAGLASAIAEDHAGGTPSWCIFDNTASNAAFGNALTLRALLAKADPRAVISA